MPVTASSLAKLTRASLNLLWAAALVCLPLTSFPLFQNFVGALVAPFSALPIGLLLAVWLGPHVLRRGALPAESRPLLAFVLVALAASAAAFFLEIPGFKERSIQAQELRALVTLGIGLAFYLVFAAWPSSLKQLRGAIQWINVGGVVMIGWTLLQVYYIYAHDSDFPRWMEAIHDLLVIQSPFSYLRGSERVSGLAYEASWFAHQLNLLYFPLWLAATYTRWSAFRFRFLRLSLENMLLPFAALAFFLCNPRIGMAALLLVAVFLFIKLNLAFYRRLSARLSRGARAPLLKGLISLGSLFAILAIYLIFAGGVIYLASLRDWRLALLLDYPPTWPEIRGVLLLDDRYLVWAGYRFAFFERVIYWVTGWNVFNQFPWLGVGLGNTGFFFPLQMPTAGLASVEIRELLYRLPVLPNTKSLWIRLLSETGLVGFAVFLAWLAVLWRSARALEREEQPVLRVLGLAGQIALVAFLMEGFSIDSFALPYLWVITGLISAAGLTARAHSRLPQSA